MTERTFAVPPEAAQRRIDQFLAAVLSELSRAQIQRLLGDGNVTLDGRPSKPSERIRAGQTIVVNLPAPEAVGIVPREIPLRIVYESPELVVIDKPAGLVVHPAPGHADDTLANALMARYPGLAVGQAQRPGIVHRLDKGTSGLMVVALTDAAYRSLAEQMAEHRVRKEYLALVHGTVTAERGTIEAPIGRDRRDRQRMGIVPEGRAARTHFQVLRRYGDYSFLRLTLETGRTHQIRVHLEGVGHPIVGDDVYGPRSPNLGLTRPFLHAWHLGFQMPDDDFCLALWSPLPPELQRVLDTLAERDLAHHTV